MSITYSNLQTRVLRLLNDPDGATYSEELVFDGLSAAHEAILPWIPCMGTATLTSGSDGRTLAVPSNCYQIQALQDNETGTFLRKATMAPGTVRSEDSSVATDWIEYPSGYLNLNPETDEGAEFTLYYLAFWEKPADEQDVDFIIKPPFYAHQGMVYYAAANCLVPFAVNTARIRQFNLRIDSGDPEDNPLKIEANYLLQLFFQEMKLAPAYVRVGL